MATGDVRRGFAVVRARAALDALERLVVGMGTSVLAVAASLWMLGTAVLCVAGVGILLVPAGLRLVRTVADRERTRLEVLRPEPVPRNPRAALAQVSVRRELGWLVCHGTLGLLLSLTALTLAVDVMHDASFPVWWWFVSPGDATPAQGFFTATDWGDAFAVCLFGVATLVVSVLVMPLLARLQEWPGRRLLAPARGTDLALRVAELTATRAAALDAHAAELRRIERSLHDGTQNRLVAVNVLLGAARRALTRDPAGGRGDPGAGPGRRRAGAGRTARGGAQHPAAGADRPQPARRARRAGRRLPGALPRSTPTCPAAARSRSRRPPTSWSPRR